MQIIKWPKLLNLPCGRSGYMQQFNRAPAILPQTYPCTPAFTPPFTCDTRVAPPSSDSHHARAVIAAQLLVTSYEYAVLMSLSQLCMLAKLSNAFTTSDHQWSFQLRPRSQIIADYSRAERLCRPDKSRQLAPSANTHPGNAPFRQLSIRRIGETIPASASPVTHVCASPKPILSRRSVPFLIIHEAPATSPRLASHCR